MAPLLLALLLLAQDAAVTAPADADGPVATAAPRKQTVAPLPIQGGPVAPPTDDYGYVGWCFGAVSGYVDLYDRAMPEVIRIERAWPTPSTEENIKQVYPAQKKEAATNIALFKRAIEAAEKASPTPIQNQGAAAIKKGRAVWTGATTVPKAQLAQFWMSWSPPGKCEETAKALEARSNLFGQALTFNAAPPATEAKAADGEKPVDVAALPSMDAPLAATAEATSDVAEAITDETMTAEAVNVDPADEGVKPTADEASVADAAVPEDAAMAPDDAADDAMGGSAIDDLIPTAAEEPAVETAEAPKKAAPAPAKPAATKKAAPKPGLKDTLKGLRPRQ